MHKEMTPEMEAVEIKKRFMQNDEYMECFPEAQEEIRGFDERDFGRKVKEAFNNPDLIQEEEEWMQADRKQLDGRVGQKFTDKELKKRDQKDQRKLQKQTDQVMAYLDSKTS